MPQNLLSELDSVPFDHVVEHFCSRIVQKVTSLVSDMETACGGKGMDVCTSWKESLPDDASFASLLEAAERSILQLPGLKIKSAFTEFDEAG